MKVHKKHTWEGISTSNIHKNPLKICTWGVTWVCASSAEFHPRQKEAPRSAQHPTELSTTSFNTCGHTAVLVGVLQTGEKGEETFAVHQELPFQPYQRTMESDSCRDPEQICICKIFSQCKEQSAPFFEITEKFSFLLISPCLVLFPTAWEPFSDFSPQGGKDTKGPCYWWRQGHGERKEHPKVRHLSLNEWPQALHTSSDEKPHLILKKMGEWKADYLWIKAARRSSLACQQLKVGGMKLPMCRSTAASGQQQAKTSNVMGFKYNITLLLGFLSSPRELGHAHKEGPLLQPEMGKLCLLCCKSPSRDVLPTLKKQEAAPGESHQAAMTKQTWKSWSLMNSTQIQGFASWCEGSRADRTDFQVKQQTKAQELVVAKLH